MDRCHFLLDISLTLTMVDWHWPVGCTPWTCSVWFASQIYRTSTGWWNDDTHLEPRSICVLSEAPTVESASMRKALGRLVSSEWSCRIALPVAGRTSLRDILVWLICEYGGKCDTCAWWTPSADQRSHNRPRDNCTECRERICGSHWNLEFSRSCLRWNRPFLREWFPLMSDLRFTFLYFFFRLKSICSIPTYFDWKYIEMWASSRAPQDGQNLPTVQMPRAIAAMTASQHHVVALISP